MNESWINPTIQWYHDRILEVEEFFWFESVFQDFNFKLMEKYLSKNSMKVHKKTAYFNTKDIPPNMKH